MDVNMERTNKMLALIHPIIHKMNGELGDFIERYVTFSISPVNCQMIQSIYHPSDLSKQRALGYNSSFKAIRSI